MHTDLIVELHTVINDYVIYIKKNKLTAFINEVHFMLRFVVRTEISLNVLTTKTDVSVAYFYQYSKYQFSCIIN